MKYFAMLRCLDGSITPMTTDKKNQFVKGKPKTVALYDTAIEADNAAYETGLGNNGYQVFSWLESKQ